MQTLKQKVYLLNLLALVGIIIVLLGSFIMEFYYHELPCPLCLLQRVGFILIGLGFVFNLRFGLHSSHYSLVLLAAIFTGFVAVRQILLHIVPGTGSYGSAIFGLHLYTWSFLLVIMIVTCISIMLGVEKSYEMTSSYYLQYKKTVIGINLIFLLLIIANIITVWAMCGWKDCPDNPLGYNHLFTPRIILSQ